jgi:effector-binding domain-containing protein
MGYQPLIEEINAVNLECSGESREVYHTWEGPDSENNVVEIQFGLAATPKG